METYSHKLTDAIEKLEPTEIIALPGRDNGLPPNVAKLLLFGLQAIAKVMLRRRRPEVLHLGDMVLWPIAIAGRLRSDHTRIVISAHGTDVAFHRRGGIKGKLYGAYLRIGSFILSKATIIANSDATANVSRETGWQKIIIVPLATDISGSETSGEHDGSILFVGRLVERKGCAWFIRNVLPILDKGLRLKVAGTCWDGDERLALNDPRVDFVGSLEGRDLTEAYRSAMCVVVPNINPKSGEFEGFGLVATEASAAGGVVLAAKTGGLVQAIRDGVTGIGVTAGNPQAWRNAISDVSNWSKEERQSFLTKSMDHCRSYYSWNRVARDTYRTYGLDPSDKSQFVTSKSYENA